VRNPCKYVFPESATDPCAADSAASSCSVYFTIASSRRSSASATSEPCPATSCALSSLISRTPHLLTGSPRSQKSRPPLGVRRSVLCGQVADAARRIPETSLGSSDPRRMSSRALSRS
jgi:hypothetical protein